MSRLPHTCGRTFRTDAGLAYHVSWCTGADAPAPVVITPAPEATAELAPAPMARCGRSDPHGAHTLPINGGWCAGNVNIVSAVDSAPEAPAPAPTPAPAADHATFADALSADNPAGSDRCTCTSTAHYPGDGVRCWRPRILGDGAPSVCWGCYSAGCDRPTAPEATIVDLATPAPETAPDGPYCAAHDLFTCPYHSAPEAPAPAAARATVVDYSAPMPTGFAIVDPFGALAPAPEAPAETAPDGCDTCGRTGAAARVCAFRRGCSCWRGVACDGLTRAARRTARKAGPAPEAPAELTPAPEAPVLRAHKADDGSAYVDMAPGVRVIVATHDGRGTDGPAGARALATWRKAVPQYRRRPTVDIRPPRVDPDATAARPIVGWRAPVSPYPAIAYVTDPGEYDARRDTCTYPRLLPVKVTPAERAEYRVKHTRGARTAGCYCGHHGADSRPGDGRTAHVLATLIPTHTAAAA